MIGRELVGFYMWCSILAIIVVGISIRLGQYLYYMVKKE